MAAAVIIAQNGNYYTLEVTLAEMVAVQTIITDATGDDLTAFVAAYAEQYEADLQAGE